MIAIEEAIWGRRRRVATLALNRGNQLQSADGEASLSISYSFSATAQGDTDLPLTLPYHCPENKSDSWWQQRLAATGWLKWSNTSQYVSNSRHSCMFVARLLPLQRKSNGICSILTGLIFHILLSTLFDLQSVDCISLHNNEGTCWGTTKHARAGGENSTAQGSL